MSAPTAEFTWEEPARLDVYTYDLKWFPREYRDRLDAEPGRWAIVADDAGRHVVVELRRRYPAYEFTGRTAGRRDRCTIYARRRAVT